jgi:tripartite-type tricarboxylate transporter receptor subunit TctC
MPYDAYKDFTPISLIGHSPVFLISSPNFEAKTAKEVIAFGKANPDKLTVAIAGTGSVVVDLFRAPSGVPTFAAIGVNGMDYEQWFGIMRPASIPKPIVEKLSSAIAQVFKMQDVKDRLAGITLDVANPEPEEMRRKVDGDIARWQKLSQELNIKPLE